MAPESNEPPRGVSSDDKASMNFGCAGLWGCLFHHHEQRNGIPHYTTSLTAVLLGGWSDDLQCESLHHLQRIPLHLVVPLNCDRIALPRMFPQEALGELQIQGYVAASGKFMQYRLWDQEKTPAFKIAYDSEMQKGIYTPEGNQPDQRLFEYISAVWLSDGRIFADNKKAAEDILKWGVFAARRTHEGCNWYEWALLKQEAKAAC